MRPRPFRRHRTPTVLQMENVECGAAALASILEYHGRVVPLAELRLACGVSRDGSTAVNIVRAARTYGLVATGYRKETVEELKSLSLPLMVFWKFRHFLVVEDFGKRRIFLNDPATGPRSVTYDEFDAGFTGVALVFTHGPDFKRSDPRPSVLALLRQRLRGSETALWFVVLLSLALVLPGLVVPAFSRIFVDRILVGGHGSWLGPLLLGMALAALARLTLTWLQQRTLLRLETKLAVVSSSRFFWHVLRLPVEFFSQRFSGEIGTRVAINDQVAQLLSGQLATSVLGLITAAFFALAMLRYSVPLTALGVAIAAVNLIVLRVVSRRRADENQRMLQESGKLTGATVAGVQMIETIKATAGESDFFAHWAGSQAKALNAQQALGVSSQLLGATPVFLTATNHAAILGFGGYLVMQGELTLGMLVAFQSLMSSFLAPVNHLVSLGSVLQTIEGGLRRLDDVMEHPVDPHAGGAVPPPGSEGAKPILKLAGELELRGVTFGYSRLKPPLLSDFSLKIPPGARVALVGPSGCGKSTVSKLVCGLYAPWSGEILFDGRRRDEIPRPVLTSSLALVDQTIFLFEGSARDNLTLWDATVPAVSVVRAAKDASIHDDLSGRPGGYEGRVEEGGRNFSGGQRQRLEIARALVNRPTLLILDEATSALDPVTEKRIDENIRRRGCACLIVAHRLSTIRDCDEIVVMDGGRIVQRGTHDELAGKAGLYAELIKQ